MITQLKNWNWKTKRCSFSIHDLQKYLLLRSVVDQKTVTIEIVHRPAPDDMKFFFSSAPFLWNFFLLISKKWDLASKKASILLYMSESGYRISLRTDYKLSVQSSLDLSAPVVCSIKSLRFLIKRLRASFLCSTFIAKLFPFSSIPFQVLGQENVIASVRCYVKASLSFPPKRSFPLSIFIMICGPCTLVFECNSSFLSGSRSYNW